MMASDRAQNRPRRHLSIRVLALLALAIAPNLQAAYEMPTHWTDVGDLELDSALGAPESVSDAALYWPEFTPSHYRRAMKDEDGRVPDEFRIPPGMEEHVRFWMRIYTFYSSQTLVLYDDRHPEVIYEIMDFRDLAAEKNPAAYEILRERKIDSRIRAYEVAFKGLLAKPDREDLTPEMRNILQAIKQCRHPHTLAEFADRVRGQTGQRDKILLGLRRADRFLPAMEQIFESYGVPPVLTRIALVESSFNPRAISRAGASGIWQFMPVSAREYMTLDDHSGLDERRSPLKSTVAAARLLRRNMSIFGSWPLTVTSYNYGLKALLGIPEPERRFPHIGEALTRCDRRYGLGYAGQNYYAEFLAILYAEKYRDLFYPALSESHPAPVRLAFHRLQHRKSALALARELKLAPVSFLEFNPDVRSLRALLPAGYRYAVPSEKPDLSLIEGTAEIVSAKKGPSPST